MKYFLVGAALVASIMGTAPIFVNAAGADFTEVKPSKTTVDTSDLKKLIDTLNKSGHRDKLAATVGPHLSLDDLAPIRFISLRPERSRWTKKYCDLVFARSDSGEGDAPQCLVLMEFREDAKSITGTHYRFDLKGHLVSAYAVRGRKDDAGKPIGGSADYAPQDVSSSETIESARKELRFWLSGEYKKYLATK